MIVHEKRSSRRLFIKPGIQERGTECGECRECGERGECSLGFRGISQRIPGNVIILTFRGMFEKIPGNVSKDSRECWQRFSRMLKKIEHFIMQLNENRIKGYILKYDNKCAQKFFKTSHVNEHVSV